MSSNFSLDQPLSEIDRTGVVELVREQVNPKIGVSDDEIWTTWQLINHDRTATVRDDINRTIAQLEGIVIDD